MRTLNALALGYAGAIIGAASMLLLGILGNLGLYQGSRRNDDRMAHVLLTFYWRNYCRHDRGGNH